MVSLINFKTVDEDLSESRRPVEEATGRRASPLTDRGLHEAGQPDGAGVQPNTGGRLDVGRPERTYAIEVEKQQHNQHQQRRQPATASQEQLEANGRSNTSSNEFVSDEANLHDANRLAAVPFPAVCLNGYDYYGCGPVESSDNSRRQSRQQVAGSAEACCSCGCDYGRPGYNAAPRDKCPASCGQSSFTVTWRRLKFCIEPKWHERIACGSSALFALASRASASMSLSSTSTSASKQSPTAKTSPAECQQTQASAQQPQVPTATRVVLDQLDGSFRSGELTAILGPSGAGKTTLLDCLTGHRKQGLSGSVRFSSSSFVEPNSPGATATVPSRTGGCQANDGQLDCCYPLHNDGEQLHNNNQNSIQTPKPKHLMHLAHTGRFSKQAADCACPGRKSPAQPLASEQATMNGDNLKVSIIPQNDHLIGHLTVYETLNYASKMKNCFEGQFDHKLNVRRVAQQLGLMSCLGTRINKLSGGQYKRVSIAQELLSSPDVLILDEPTSGLDAMTCYQTVQVLKQLTDGCQASGQKPIAVILTIHQPNSDVFQQFNHVYVVAQGGKCIYEGPPGNIESVINRVGICLPNSYYNPATMIVEIAAGKFGQAAILKLNTIQKKQYSQQRTVAADEQNSTGDSAVDCPSSNYEDEDEDDDENDADDANDDLGGDANHMQQHRLKDSNPHELAAEQAKGGAINAGFTMDGEPDKDANNNIDQDRKQTIKMGDTCFVAGAEFAPVVGLDNKLCGSACAVGASEKQDRRKRRRRMRRRTGETMTTTMTTSTNVDLSSGELLGANTILVGSTKSKPSSAVRILMNTGCGGGGGGGDGDSGTGSDAGGGHSGRSEKRLKLNSLKTDQKFPFWRHTYLHFHRSWLSIVRDPMLCSMQLALHIIVPVMVSLVYGTDVGKPNACPRAGPIDIMAYALEPIDTALQLQEDLRTTLENIGYIFFKLYGIIFAAMTVTVLTFPLDMHVLVKEFRNGWYGLSSYFLGRTLADIPFQLTLPLLAMSLSYYATGQPYSYFQWRFFSITAILILSSLIAQSQGLLFGAILMDKMKAAVFVAPAATTPIILFAGFLVRTQSIPSYLRPLSNLSYLRYAIEACLISRYGFNQCECDPAIFNQTVPELPPIARSMLDYWLSSFKPTELTAANGTQLDSMSTGSSLSPSSDSIDSASKPDLFTKLIDSLSRANSFGRNITSCEQVVPYPMIDYDLKDEQLVTCFAILVAMLLFTRLLTFFIVCFKVKRKV